MIRKGKNDMEYTKYARSGAVKRGSGMPGEMDMPANFRYTEAVLAGRPRHGKFDVFSSRHPSMPVGRRAKIFAPFDALKGFSEAIAEQAAWS